MTLTTGGPYFDTIFNGPPKEMVAPTVAWTKAALKAMDDKGYKDCVGMDAELAKLQMTIY